MEIRDDGKTLVDWINGKAKQKTTVGAMGELPGNTEGHTLHNKEAVAWAGRGVRGRTDEREYDSQIVWSEVTGPCGFWDVEAVGTTYAVQAC